MATPNNEQAALVLAYFKPKDSKNKQDTVEVQFNPESLQYTLQSNNKEQGKGGKKKQHVAQATAKLTMKLVFDSTHTGVDVRTDTNKIAALLKPKDASSVAPPEVEFGWGAYKFSGIIEQYKESIDYFAPQGVPLRASVDLTLSNQDAVFESSLNNPLPSVDSPQAGQEPTLHGQPNAGAGGGAAGLANDLGNPRAARAIASLNGSASLRFSAGGQLAVSGGVKLQAAAAFSAGASASAGAGAGIGIGGGAGIGIGGSAGAGFGISGSAGAGIGLSGGVGISASAGLGISAGASAGAGFSGGFSGLRASAETSLSVPSGRALFSAEASTVNTGANAQFAVGGRAQTNAGASLAVDVGANADLNAHLKFD
jgi:hypothetical protein